MSGEHGRIDFLPFHLALDGGNRSKGISPDARKVLPLHEKKGNGNLVAVGLPRIAFSSLQRRFFFLTDKAECRPPALSQ
jgi:hypothetical protein